MTISEWFILLGQIMLVNAILSGDNALVIALASRQLPEHQRKLAMWWGAIGAVVLRILLTFVVFIILKVQFIQLFGAALLVWISIKLLTEQNEQEGHVPVHSIWHAIWIILSADFIMSLDNVLAIAAIAEDSFNVIIVGIALSLPIIVWGSQFLLKLMDRLPILIWFGAGLLGYTAGEMLLRERFIDEWVALHSVMWHQFIPILFAAFVIAAGFVLKRREKSESDQDVMNSY